MAQKSGPLQIQKVFKATFTRIRRKDARRMAWYEIERFSEGVEFHVDAICVHVDFAECLKVGLKSLL